LFLSGVFLVLFGCGGKPAGTVSGTVKYKGNPVASGSVNFYDGKTGNASQATLNESGKFTFPGTLAAGTYKVYVSPPVPEQLPPGQAPKKLKFDLPPKYQDPAQTPVSKEVKAGPNDITIDLE